MPGNDCENSCILKSRVDRLEKDMASEKEARSKSYAEFYSRLNKLESAQAVNVTKLDTIVDKLDDITARLVAMEGKPGKRWETVVAAIITGVVGFLLAKAGMG